MKKTSRRPRRRAEDIVEILDRLRKSGLTQAAFSARNGVAVSTLQYWLRKQRDGQLSRRPSKALAPARLVPVRVVDTPAVVERVEVEFELAAGGGTLRLRGEVSPELLARYAKALGYPC